MTGKGGALSKSPHFHENLIIKTDAHTQKNHLDESDIDTNFHPNLTKLAATVTTIKISVCETLTESKCLTKTDHYIDSHVYTA